MTARHSRGQPRTLPLPDYDLSGSNAVALNIYGAVIDDNYTEQLMKNSDLLWDKLSDALDDGQKRNKVMNLLTKLRTSGQIANAGSRSKPRWLLT